MDEEVRKEAEKRIKSLKHKMAACWFFQGLNQPGLSAKEREDYYLRVLEETDKANREMEA